MIPSSPDISLGESKRKLTGAFCAAGITGFSFNKFGQVSFNGKPCGRFGTSEDKRIGEDLTTLWLEDEAIVKLHKMVTENGFHIRDIEALGIAVRFEPPRMAFSAEGG